MAYPAFNQTIAALNNFGGTLNTLNALSLAEKNAELEHKLNLKKLDMQKAQTEQQGRLSLLNADIAAKDRAENRAFREKGLALDERRTTLAETEAVERRKANETQAEFERFNNTVAPLGEVYAMVLDRQKIPPERKAEMLKQMQAVVSGVNPKAWTGVLTTPAKAQEVIMDIEKMRNDLAMRQISTGTPGAAARTLLTQARYFADQYTRGNVDPNDPEVRRQVAEFGQMGIEISNTTGAKEVNGEMVQAPVYTVKMVDPEVAMTTRINRANDDLARKYPAYGQMDSPSRMQFLKQYMDLDDMNDSEGKQRLIQSAPGFNVVQPYAPGTKPGKMPTTGGVLKSPTQQRSATPQQQGMGFNPQSYEQTQQAIGSIPGKVGRTTIGAGLAVANTAKNFVMSPGSEYSLIPDQPLPPDRVMTADALRFPLGKEWATTPVESQIVTSSRENRPFQMPEFLESKPKKQKDERIKFANDLLSFVNR